MEDIKNHLSSVLTSICHQEVQLPCHFLPSMFCPLLHERTKHTHTHSHSHTQTQTYTQTLTHSHTNIHKHTLTHSLTYTQTHTFSLSLSHVLQSLRYFPSLSHNIHEVAVGFLNKCLPEAMGMVRNLIAIEVAYINTDHPEFKQEETMEAVLKNCFGQKEEEDPLTLATKALASRGWADKNRDTDTQTNRHTETETRKRNLWMRVVVVI